jgi:hypothetical protein
MELGVWKDYIKQVSNTVTMALQNHEILGTQKSGESYPVSNVILNLVW